VEGVRVIDASVIPNLMRGHPHPQVSMVALRGAELIEQTAVQAAS
jgi:choline dehydrogenase-like flavoprotein